MVSFTTDPLRLVLAVLFVLVPLWVSAQPDPPRQAFIELSASEDRLYVQQQLHLRVRLFYSNDVIQGQLQNPEHPDVVIEQLGEQKQYRELLNGESYRVVERNFALFPQKPGQLQLPPVEFHGTARHPRGHGYPISDSAILFPLEIQDIPASFSGRHWLPANAVEIHERGLDISSPVKPGANLTRTLVLTAEGLPGATLPDLTPAYPDALRAYPEPAQRQSSLTDERVVGQMEQTLALVPVPGHSGEVVLPEIRVPWWDVTEDREKVAVLPARTLQLTGLSNAGAQSQQSPSHTTEDALSLTSPEYETSEAHWVWPLLAALFGLGWLTTMAAWWLQVRIKRKRPVGRGQDSDLSTSREQTAFAMVAHQARTLDPAFFTQFPVWARLLTGQRCATVEAALEQLDQEDLRQKVSQWQRALFGPAPETAPEGESLEAALRQARRDWQQDRQNRSRKPGLPDFYPAGIRP